MARHTKNEIDSEMTVSPKKNSRNAVFLMGGDEQYGVGISVMSLAIGIQRQGWFPHALSFQDGVFHQRALDAGLEATCLGVAKPQGFNSRSPIAVLKALLKNRRTRGAVVNSIANHLKSSEASHLCVSWPSHVRLGGLAARQAGIPCYWLMPNVLGDRWPLDVNRWLYRKICLSLGITPLPNSQFTGDTLGGDVGQQVLYLGVDEERFAPSKVDAIKREALGIPASTILVGIFARLDPAKGQQVMLNAIARAVDEGHDVALLLIGAPEEGPFAKELRKQADEANIGDRLHFVGWTSTPERYYGAIDFAMNAHLAPEAFGLSVVEAMLMERPVLVHALGGPAETVVDGVTGWHVHAPTVDAYYEGLVRAIKDRTSWREMGLSARQHALQNFSLEAFASKYLAIVGLPAATD